MRNRFLGKFFEIWLIVRVPGSGHNTLQMNDKTFDEVTGPHSHNPKLSHTHITLTHTPTHTTHTHTTQAHTHTAQAHTHREPTLTQPRLAVVSFTCWQSSQRKPVFSLGKDTSGVQNPDPTVSVLCRGLSGAYAGPSTLSEKFTVSHLWSCSTSDSHLLGKVRRKSYDTLLNITPVMFHFSHQNVTASMQERSGL